MANSKAFGGSTNKEKEKGKETFESVSKSEETEKAPEVKETPEATASNVSPEAELLKELLAKQERLEKRIAEAEAAPSKSSDSSALEKLVTHLIEENNKKTVHSMTSLEETPTIDVDDYLEEGETFFSYNFAYVISSDIIRGRESLPPYGQPIVFDKPFRKNVGQGKSAEMYYVSTYTSHSKKEIEWLKSTRFYETCVFGRRATATVEGAKEAMIISRYMAAYKNLSPQEAIKVATSKGISDINIEDIDSLKQRIAMHDAKAKIKADEASSKIALVETAKAEALLKG